MLPRTVNQASRHLGTRRWLSKLQLLGYDSQTTSIDINGKKVVYNNLFLRDSDTSIRLIDSSSQKSFNTGDASRDLKFKVNPTINDQGNLEITWSDATGETPATYTPEFLWKHSLLANSLAEKFYPQDQIPWDNLTYAPFRVTFDQYLLNHKSVGNVGGFDATVNQLNVFGLSFITDIPRPSETIMSEENWQIWPVAKLAQKFGYIKKTFYGTLFDVKNENEKAVNIANKSTFLPLHMDLLYYESPPGLQFLHFIDNSTTGGENIFADSFAAVKYVQGKDPEAYIALKEIPITYKYDNDGEYYYYARPLVVENPLTGELDHVNYSPPFQGPFELGIWGKNPKFEAFLRGLRLFEDFVNNSDNQYIIKNTEGTAVVFDNRRVLHSRNEFSDKNGGKRWLMGCYVDGDSYRSSLRMTKRRANEADSGK